MSSRINFPGGPAYFSFNGLAAQMEDHWSVTSEPTQFAVTTNLQGKVDLREEDTIAKLSARLLGIWGDYASLYPYQPSMLGQLIFPATDQTLAIQTAAGESITFAAAALSKMPTLQFAGNKTLFGPAEWTMLRRMDEPSTTAGAMYTLAASTYTEPALNPQLVLTSAATLSFGSLTNIETEEDGVTFTPTVKLSPRKTSLNGICNYMITEVGATVEFTPEGLTESDLYNSLHPLQGASTGRGTSLAGIGGTLTVTSLAAGGPTLTLPLAAPTKSSLRFDPKTGRVGRVTLQAMRANTSGVLQALFTLGTVE
jgi:hypothetical protein